jgi:uncharacterized repeat protein (TIGR03803 family)
LSKTDGDNADLDFGYRAALHKETQWNAYGTGGVRWGTSSEGYFPEAGVSLDKSGNLYGTAFDGGALGFGSVFELTASGELITLFNFDNTHGQWAV